MKAPGLPARALRAGLVGGLAAAYVSAVGMVEKFSGRNLVGSTVTTARALLALIPLATAYMALRPRLRGGVREHPSGRPAALAAAAAGGIAALVLVAWLGVVDLVGQQTVRAYFIAVSPRLMAVLRFERGAWTGAAILVAGGVAFGAAGAGLRLMPARARRVLTTGLSAVLVAGLLQRIVPPALSELGLDPDWLYSPITGGLTLAGALFVLAVAGAVPEASRWLRARSRAPAEPESLSPRRPSAGRAVAGVVVLAALLALPQLVGSVFTNVLGGVAIYVLMGIGLNIVVGYAGLLDLGYVAFFAVGAYFIALFTGAHLVAVLGASTQAGPFALSFYAALPLVILVAAFVGLLIGAPVLRLRGDYLAIVTLGFGEIAGVLAASDWLRPVLGGAQGLQKITDASIAGFGFRNESIYYLAVVLCLVAIYVSWRLQGSRVGRAWNAMREDEQVAEVMGISITKYKLLAFAMGAAIGCLSGALFAVQIGSLTPTSFDFEVSVTALAIVILGGMGSIRGVIVGALALKGIPDLLDEFEQFRLLIYGAVLIGIMILRPQGLIPNVRRLRELRDEERTQDRWLAPGGTAATGGEG